MMPAASATSRIMKIGLSSETLDLIELSAISYWTIRQRLMRVPGVRVGRHLRRAAQAAPRPGRPGASCASYGITIDQVMEAGSEALDAGVLQYAKSFTVGQGGFVEYARPAAEHRERPADQDPAELAKVPGRQARRPRAARWPTSAASSRTTSSSGARASSTAGPACC